MPKRSAFDPIVLAGKTVFLQRIQEAVVAGYAQYVLGSVSVSKAQSLAKKFALLYGVEADKYERCRRKAAGIANARLFLRLCEADRVDYALLVSPGLGAVHKEERLREATVVPISYENFELVQLTLKGRSKPGWTWRLDRSAIETWQARLREHTARNDRHELFRDWRSLYTLPGFAGVRRQVGDLVAFWRGEWRDLRGKSACPICYPHDDLRYRARPGVSKGSDGRYYAKEGFPSSGQLPLLYYVRKQADFGDRLSVALAALKARESSSLRSETSADTFE